MAFIAAALLTVGLLLPGGIRAAALAVPWLVTAVIHLAMTVFSLSQASGRTQARRTTTTGQIAAFTFLVIGAAWSILACGGWPVLGFDPVIVQLTAIHFHYAGFALTLLATKASLAVPGRLANLSIAIILMGVPAVAAGISLRSIAIEWIAAGLLTCGCCLVGLLQFRVAFTARTALPRTLLMVSSISLLSGMALAIAYATGRQFNLATLDIPTMIRTHGLIESLGFAFLGLLGWLTLTRSVSENPSPAPQPPVSSLQSQCRIIPHDRHARAMPLR
jgi:hypothetical protein